MQSIFPRAPSFSKCKRGNFEKCVQYSPVHFPRKIFSWFPVLANAMGVILKNAWSPVHFLRKIFSGLSVLSFREPKEGTISKNEKRPLHFLREIFSGFPNPKPFEKLRSVRYQIYITSAGSIESKSSHGNIHKMKFGHTLVPMCMYMCLFLYIM